MIRITSKKDGFRRAGLAHNGVKEYPDSRFTAAQLALLKTEPNLIVQELPDEEDEAEKESKAKAGAKAKAEARADAEAKAKAGQEAKDKADADAETKAKAEEAAKADETQASGKAAQSAAKGK